MEAGLYENSEIRAPALPTARVQYFGAIGAAAGKREEKVEFAPHTTAYELLQKLAGGYGKRFRGEIFEEDADALRDDLMVTVNEAITPHEDLAGLTLNQGDVVSLFPIFPGGG